MNLAQALLFVLVATALHALLACHGLPLTSLGGYVYYDRLRVPYAPLLIMVVWAPP